MLYILGCEYLTTPVINGVGVRSTYSSALSYFVCPLGTLPEEGCSGKPNNQQDPAKCAVPML